MTNSLRPRRTPWLAAFAAAACLLLAGCGGGKSASVSSLTASNVRFNGTMNVNVSGAGLNDPGITMTVDGPCVEVTRLPGAQDFQTQFSCRVDGVGDIRVQVRGPGGSEIASLKLLVPQPQVTINVRSGSVTAAMTVDLDAVAAPITVKNFLTYVAAGLYRNTIFHRVEKGQLIQGGGYTNGPTAVTGLRGPIVLESNNGLKNVRGSIGMARSALFDSAQAEFYLNIADNPGFDYVSAERPGYAVFGQLSSGLDVMDVIGDVPTEPDQTGRFPNLPILAVVIASIVQTR